MGSGEVPPGRAVREVRISTDCCKAARDADTDSKEERLAAKRAEEQQAATEWAMKFDSSCVP